MRRHRAGRAAGLSFSRRELRDLAVAWVALGVAFTILLNLRSIQAFISGGTLPVGRLAWWFGLSMGTVGVGFLLHELGHKVVAVRFGQRAEFRADYSMLAFALLGAMVGFLFAAPGAVYHRGRLTERERGLIALAGPAVNIALAAVFFAMSTSATGYLGLFGRLGYFINILLAAFNMLPVGPLDGRTVLDWSPPVFAIVFLPTVFLALDLLGFLSL